MKRKLVIVLAVDVDPATTDPEELAYYLLDADCDDPPAELCCAEWDDVAVSQINDMLGLR